jgi:hypothetical protein
VHQKSITTAAALTDKLKKVIPDDKKFAEDFAVFEVSNEGHARYLLKALDIAKSGLALAGSSTNDEPTVEHVLPKTPKNLSDWSFTPEEHGEYVYRLGNQALVPNAPNSIAGNEKFSIKRPILEKQPNQLTKEIGQLSKWGKDEINDRQQRLATIAVKAWSIRV